VIWEGYDNGLHLDEAGLAISGDLAKAIEAEKAAGFAQYGGECFGVGEEPTRSHFLD
jgi:hypothetical protein